MKRLLGPEHRSPVQAPAHLPESRVHDRERRDPPPPTAVQPELTGVLL